MSTITKLRKRADGSLEHYLETTETPASLNAKATALLEKSKAKMLENVEPTERTVTGLFLSPRTPDGKYAENDEYGGVEKIIRKGAKEPQQYAEIVTGNAADAPMAAAPDDLHRAAKRLKE